MAKFDAKSFNEKAFGKYMSAIPNVKLNKLRESRAIVGDARLRDTFVNNSQTGHCLRSVTGSLVCFPAHHRTMTVLTMLRRARLTPMNRVFSPMAE